MRTTLTLDDDVAARLLQLQRQTGTAFETLLNNALRAGLQQLGNPPAAPTPPYQTRPVSLGKCRLGNIVSVTEALAAAEGEDYT